MRSTSFGALRNRGGIVKGFEQVFKQISKSKEPEPLPRPHLFPREAARLKPAYAPFVVASSGKTAAVDVSFILPPFRKNI